MNDSFINVIQAGLNTVKPTEKQAVANNYKKGRCEVHGLKIAIENPRNSIREGCDANGKPWQNLMKATYGHFEKFIGNDGDGVDCFIGEWPESALVYVINQKNGNGTFDEHKVMLGFTSKDNAIHAYNKSYSQGWNGLQSITALSVEQLRWWLQYGNKKLPVTQEILPFDSGVSEMINTDTLDAVFDSIVKSDAGDYLMDSCTIQDVLDSESEGMEAFDAIAIPYQKLNRKMSQMMGILKIVAGDTVYPVSYQVTEPYKTKGTTNVAAVFELSDGQTISIFFHNPDVTPNKIMPLDEIISWKWLLNKKDVTVLVAPENGKDLNVREVSRRIMKIAEKNSERFKKANADKATRIETIDALKASVALKESQLAELDAEIASIEANKVQEKHYSEFILEELEKSFGWVKNISGVEKEFLVESRSGGDVNPTGKTIVTANFDDSGRYLSAYLGIDLLTDMDMRDRGLKQEYTSAASEFNDKVSRSLSSENIVNSEGIENVAEYVYANSSQADYKNLRDGIDTSDILVRKTAKDNGIHFQTLMAAVKKLALSLVDKAYMIKTDAEEKKTLLIGLDAKEFDKKMDDMIEANNVILELPVTEFRPEEMRVIDNGSGLFLVQTKSPEGEWITQKEHADKDAAIADAEGWYSKPLELESYFLRGTQGEIYVSKDDVIADSNFIPVRDKDGNANGDEVSMINLYKTQADADAASNTIKTSIENMQKEKEDIDYVQSAIDGKLDFYDKSVTDKLAELSRKYTSGEIADLLKQAKTAIKQFFANELTKKMA